MVFSVIFSGLLSIYTVMVVMWIFIIVMQYIMLDKYKIKNIGALEFIVDYIFDLIYYRHFPILAYLLIPMLSFTAFLSIQSIFLLIFPLAEPILRILY